MKRKIKYTNKPLGDVRVVDDFLPAPKGLVLRQQKSLLARKTTRHTKRRINKLDALAEKALKDHKAGKSSLL